jgi:hypothetical protein
MGDIMNMLSGDAKACGLTPGACGKQIEHVGPDVEQSMCAVYNKRPLLDVIGVEIASEGDFRRRSLEVGCSPRDKLCTIRSGLQSRLGRCSVAGNFKSFDRRGGCCWRGSRAGICCLGSLVSVCTIKVRE